MHLTLKIISGLLILFTSFLSIKHAWGGLTGNLSAQEAALMDQLQFSRTVVFIISLLSLASGLMVLFPSTFFAGNLVSALVIVTIMAAALKNHQMKTALIEIPFLIIPLALIYLGHPFRK